MEKKREYLNAHGHSLEAAFAEAMAEAIRVEATNPLLFVGQHLVSRSNDMQQKAKRASQTVNAPVGIDPYAELHAKWPPDLTGGYPAKLGSFELIKVDIGSLKLRIFDVEKKTGGRYELDLTRPVFKTLASKLGTKKIGRLSLHDNMSLPKDAREKANISQDATSFAFAYPAVTTSEEIDALQEPCSDELLFLRNGGYVYFDKSRKLCGVNVMKPGNGLT